MAVLAEKDLLDEFLFGRSKLVDNLSYERFKRLFPKGTSEDILNEIYGHLRKLDSKTRKSLKKSLENTSMGEKRSKANQFSIGIQEHDTIGKINNNLNLLSNILDSELEASLKEYNTELELLKSGLQGLEDLTFIGDPNENYMPARELMELVNKLQNDVKQW